MPQFDLGWGNPNFLLDILEEKGLLQLAVKPSSLIYPPDGGIIKLVDQTRRVIQETTNINYRYVIITAGATQGIVSALRHYKATGVQTVVTGKYGYPFYDGMIEKSGLERSKKDILEAAIASPVLFLVDSPSNPEGKQSSLNSTLPTIWDSVYHNNIYTKNLKQYPRHDLMAGSYSKLLGVAGVRVGWLATNDGWLNYHLQKTCLNDTAGVSIVSQQIMSDILKRLDLSSFMVRGQLALDHHRSLFDTVKNIFDNQAVQEVGMFYFAQADKKALDILNKVGVGFVEMGDSYIRLNMGQSRTVIENAIAAIKIEDKI